MDYTKFHSITHTHRTKAVKAFIYVCVVYERMGNMLDFIWDAFEKTGDIQFYLLYKSFKQEYDEMNANLIEKRQNENTPLC